MIGWKTTLPVYVLKSLHTEQCDKSVCKRLLKEITNQSYHDKHRMTAIDHTDSLFPSELAESWVTLFCKQWTEYCYPSWNISTETTKKKQ